LANDGGNVAVYQGQPGGVLWFKPLKVFDTNYKVSDLNPVDQSDLSQTIAEPTLTDALDYATSLCDKTSACQALTRSPTTTTTSTTTTTVKG
jgi:PPM family protein phosphatase